MAFITFEGIDGCGKSTQAHLLAARLRAGGRDVVETLEPGGTEAGRQIRKILLDPANRKLSARAELLLYFASRAQNVAEVIAPAIARGAIVICDRFTDSTIAYQGCGRGLDTATILTLDRIASAGLAPDLTILIDIDVPASMARTSARNLKSAADETRIDDEPAEFHARVRAGFLGLAVRHPDRVHVIDGSQNIDAVADNVWSVVTSHV
jgi:dTMP kinase